MQVLDVRFEVLSSELGRVQLVEMDITSTSCAFFLLQRIWRLVFTAFLAMRMPILLTVALVSLVDLQVQGVVPNQLGISFSLRQSVRNIPVRMLGLLDPLCLQVQLPSSS